MFILEQEPRKKPEVGDGNGDHHTKHATLISKNGPNSKQDNGKADEGQEQEL